MTSPLVSVLILSRERPERLRACLASVERQDYTHREVIVLANGCLETAALVRTAWPSVTLIELPENIGCAPGRNRITQAAKGDYLLFLDDDGELGSDDALTTLVAALDADPRVGVAKMALYDAVSDEPTGWRLRASRLDFRCYDASFGGGAALIRAAAFSAAGGYSEAFRGHGEEFDLSVRLYDAGFAVLHCADVAFRHHVDKSDDDWQRELTAGYQHIQYTICRLYADPLRRYASWKALLTQAYVALRLWRGRGLMDDLRESRRWARRGRGDHAPVHARSLELLYYGKYYRVSDWTALERAPRGLLPMRVLIRRLRRKLARSGKLSQPNS